MCIEALAIASFKLNDSLFIHFADAGDRLWDSMDESEREWLRNRLNR